MPRLAVPHAPAAGAPERADVDLYYEDHGTGSPVVLIHGWPLSGRSWEAQVPALVDAGHRVISYDRRGFGSSAQPWGGYDYDTFTADLHALLTHLDLTGATLVGFSMGGGEVVRYVARHGTSRVARAVLAAAVTPYLYQSDDNPEGGLDDATIEAFQTGVRTDRIAFLEDFTTRFFSAGRGLTGPKLTVSEPQRQYARHLAELASPRGTLECVTAFGRTDFRDDVEALAASGIPVLVIHGDSDAIVPFEVSGERTAKLVPGARLHVVEGGPHGINASHAAEFNQVLLSFLAG